MNHPGEIAALAKLAAPDVAIITNIGVAHIEFMGIARSDRAGKRRARGSGRPERHRNPECGRSVQRGDRAAHARPRSFLPESNSGAVRARAMSGRARAARSSRSWKARIAAARNCRCRVCTWCRMRCSRSRPGAPSALSLEECAAGLASAPLTKARLQITRDQRRAIHRRQLQRQSRFDESGACARWWNSMRTASASPCSGEMGELGEESERGHREVGEAAAALRHRST